MAEMKKISARPRVRLLGLGAGAREFKGRLRDHRDVHGLRRGRTCEILFRGGLPRRRVAAPPRPSTKGRGGAAVATWIFRGGGDGRIEKKISAQPRVPESSGRHHVTVVAVDGSPSPPTDGVASVPPREPPTVPPRRPPTASPAWTSCVMDRASRSFVRRRRAVASLACEAGHDAPRDGPRRRRGCRVDVPWGRATPRRQETARRWRRGCPVDSPRPIRGDAAAATWIFRGDGSAAGAAFVSL